MPREEAPPVSLAQLVFGPEPTPSLANLLYAAWARGALRHALTMAGTAPSSEDEAFLVALLRRATVDPAVTFRRVSERVQAVQACLPPEVASGDVLSVLVRLDPQALRVIASMLAWMKGQVGRRMRAIKAAQRQWERLNLSPHSTAIVREDAALAIADLAGVRARYAQAHRLIQRLAPPKREALLTEEARQLLERCTQAGLSKRRGYRLIAVILRNWHGLPEDALTGDHIRVRLQTRPEDPPGETRRH